jgi:hypothetical protein
MLRGVALALTVRTGFSGMVYEVTWEKVVATLLGSYSVATAAVRGLFLSGLAAGYALFGRPGGLVETRSRLGDLGLAGAAGDS